MPVLDAKQPAVGTSSSKPFARAFNASPPMIDPALPLESISCPHPPLPVPSGSSRCLLPKSSPSTRPQLHFS